MARYNVGKGKSGNDVFTLDKLVTNALREKHSGAMVVVTPQYKTYKSKFEKTLIGKARITKTDEKAQEISKIQVDVNEKIYTNRGSNNKGEDEGDDTKVLIVKRSKSSDAYSYEQQTTKGLEWGAGRLTRYCFINSRLYYHTPCLGAINLARRLKIWLSTEHIR